MKLNLDYDHKIELDSGSNLMEEANCSSKKRVCMLCVCKFNLGDQ